MVNEMGRPKGQALREMGRVVWREFKGVEVAWREIDGKEMNWPMRKRGHWIKFQVIFPEKMEGNLIHCFICAFLNVSHCFYLEI
jgi:hypothetical protein